MSDGPYRSLPMRTGWKDVSERAHKAIFTMEERETSMCAALHKDFKRDVGKAFLTAIDKVLTEQVDGNLLAPLTDFELTSIRDKFGPSALRDAVIEHIQAAWHHGHRGDEALIEGVNRAAQDHGQACIRQVEEHYKRDASNNSEHQKAVSVRDILTTTVLSPRVRQFGNEIRDLVHGDTVVTRIVKATGTNDGPEIG